MEEGDLKIEEIERPNIHDEQAFQGWLDRYVTYPDKGLDDLPPHEDGTPLSEEEKLEINKNQIKTWLNQQQERSAIREKRGLPPTTDEEIENNLIDQIRRRTKR